MKTHRCPPAVARRLKAPFGMILLVVVAMLAACSSGSNPVEGQSPQAPAVNDANATTGGGDDVEYSDPSQLQVLQVWCVYEFDTDACVELEADYGHTVDDNYGIGDDITAASVEDLTALCAAGAGDRVACAELARR